MSMPSTHVLTEHSLYQALEAMRLGQELPDLHPLKGLLPIKMHPVQHEQVDDKTFSEVQTFTYLTQLISRRYRYQRSVMELPEIDTKASISSACAALTEDFKVNNSELEAASVLYYRYGRIDLEMNPEMLSDVAGIGVRGIHRRQQLGIRRLMQQIIKRKIYYDKQDREPRLRAQLPYPVFQPLYGRAAEYEAALYQLKKIVPHQVILHGIQGIGKTALACNLVHTLISENQIDAVFWFEQANNYSLGWLVNEISNRLNIDAHDVPVYLQQTKAMFVFDNAEALFEDILEANKVTAYLAGSKAVFCTRRIPSRVTTTCISLRQLNKSDTLDWLYPSPKIDSIRPSLEDFDTLFDKLGGNPQLLKQAIVYRSNATQLSTTLNEIFIPIWNRLSLEARELWYIMASNPLNLSLSSPLDAMDELIQCGVVDCNLSNHSVQMNNAAYTYYANFIAKPQVEISHKPRLAANRTAAFMTATTRV